MAMGLLKTEVYKKILFSCYFFFLILVLTFQIYVLHFEYKK
jgi:hypothetical protein